MKIRSFAHKRLKALYTDNMTKGVPPDLVYKLRKVLAFLDDLQDPEELRSLPVWTRWLGTARALGASV